jgi:predicted DNA-binding transcriptional regulator AlpA
MQKRKTAAQVAIAKKAAALKDSAAQSMPPTLAAANEAHIADAGLAPDTIPDQHDRKRRAHGVRAPPVRLLNKTQVCAIANVTFPTIWAWMRAGTFPRSRVVSGKSMWLSTEIDEWLRQLPLRPLKGDAPDGSAF